MSLLKRQTRLPVYKQATGWEYPWAIQAYEDHLNMHWVYWEIPLDGDLADYKKASKEEQEYIASVMKLFTGNEVLVENGYVKLMSIFAPNELMLMWSEFTSRESIHQMAYSLFTETIGLGDAIYTEFLDIPVMNTKTTYVDKAKVKKFEEYKAMGLSNAELDREYRRDIAKMLAIYGGGTEAISLYAQFAALLAFQFQNKYKGLCQIVEYSLKDEYHHFITNSKVFREFIKENPDIWDDQLKFEIYESIREVVAYEKALVDYFRPPHMEPNELKRYIEFQADRALLELGMKANYGIKENPFKWIDEVTESVVLANFFEAKSTEYSKGSLTGDWGELRQKLIENRG